MRKGGSVEGRGEGREGREGGREGREGGKGGREGGSHLFREDVHHDSEICPDIVKPGLTSWQQLYICTHTQKDKR